jgi:hypothetical protein
VVRGTPSNVSFWHKADMRGAAFDVRFRGKVDMSHCIVPIISDAIDPQET